APKKRIPISLQEIKQMLMQPAGIVLFVREIPFFGSWTTERYMEFHSRRQWAKLPTGEGDDAFIEIVLDKMDPKIEQLVHNARDESDLRGGIRKALERLLSDETKKFCRSKRVCIKPLN